MINHQNTFLLVILVIGLAIMFDQAQGQSCKTVLSDMTKMQMAMMSKCAKSMKFKNAKEKSAKSMCVMKCVLQDVGMLNAEGKTDDATMGAMAVKFFPSETDREHVKGVMMPCVDNAKTMDPTDEFCKSYEPFVKCLMGKMGNMCPSA